MEQVQSARKRRAGGITVSLLCLLALTSLGFAEPRVFTDTKGREIIAELVAWKGDTITLKKDGKTLDTSITLFSAEDQAFIKEWMKKNPEQVVYSLDIEVDKKKLEGVTTGSGYYRKKSGKYAYHVTVKNRSRDDARGLQVKYRAYMIDRVSDSFYANSSPDTVIKEGTKKIPTLKFNLAAEFDTDTFEMKEAQQYDSTRVVKDELIGILVRVLDANGNVVGDFRDGNSQFKNVKWDKEDGEDDGVTIK